MNNDDHIGELLKLAGRRPMPGDEQMSRAKAAARAEWMHLVDHQRRQRRPSLSWAFGGAAIVAIAVFSAVWLRPDESRAPHIPPAEVATLQTVVGTLRVTREGVAPKIVNELGFRLLEGDRLDTPTGSRAAFSLVGGTSLRLDHDSAVRLDGGGSVTLSQGAVFVDAEPERDGNDRWHRASALSVHVSTPFGVVRHVGTQFEVRLDTGELRVHVREGSVAVENADGRWLSREGEGLRVTLGRPPERQSILTYGSEWSWVDELAPPFVLEGSTLSAFLHWASRHQGLRWQYGDDELRDRAESIVLHGSVEGLSGEEAFEAVVRTSGLTFRRSGDRLIIAQMPAQ
jgi:ferric-dicitrate binding protein FerR (iron transport regulator)